MKNLLTFLLVALLAFSVGWAETTTVTASRITSSSVTWTGSGNETWNVIVNGGATNQNVISDYAQVGSRNSPSTSITFSTSGITGTITSIVVNCASYNGLATLSATVGGNAFGNQQPTPSWSNNSGGNVTFSGSASGAIVITMTNGNGGRAMYIKSITVTYTPGSTPPAPDNWYRKVTSTDDLVVGKKYIFIKENGSSSVGMGTVANNYGTPVTGLTVEDNRVNIGGTDVMEFTLGGASSAWTFKNSNNYYLGARSTSGDNLINSGEIKPFIVVTPNGRAGKSEGGKQRGDHRLLQFPRRLHHGFLAQHGGFKADGPCARAGRLDLPV